MRLIPLLLLVWMLFPGRLHGMELRKPPDAGISNTELERLGNAADDELVKRFLDRAQENYRDGILIRMGAFGNLSRPNPRIQKVLISFVEAEVSGCKGQVELNRIWMIGSALQIIGQRGGQPGIDYLKSWIGDPAVYERISCFAQKSDAATTRSQLRRDALTGLGRNGTKKSLGVLMDFAKNPPPDKFPGSFMGVLNGAVSENKLIQTEGVKKHFAADREFFTRRVE